MGIGFAVPVDMAMGIKDQIVATGRVTRGYIGVILNPGELTSDLAASLGYTKNGGVLVSQKPAYVIEFPVSARGINRKGKVTAASTVTIFTGTDPVRNFIPVGIHPVITGGGHENPFNVKPVLFEFRRSASIRSE